MQQDQLLNKVVASFRKSWTASQGTLTPFASSSSTHAEQSDNHLEHYVKQNKEENSPSISSMFTSDLFSEGGEKVTEEKTFDIGESATKDASYDQDTNTTEPDPLSDNAVKKAKQDIKLAKKTIKKAKKVLKAARRPDGADDVVGEAAYGTTANTTEDAPTSGETTEPTKAVNKAEDACCPDCNEPMEMCKCGDMAKADDEAAETTPDDEKAEGEEPKKMNKSLWGGKFLPID